MIRGSVFIANSLDGFIARPDGAIDWLAQVERPGEDYGYAAFFGSVQALVMGRNTYDVVAGFPSWPYGDKRVVVLTHRALTPRTGVEAFAGDPRALMADLERQGVERVYVDGGQVIGQFLEADRVDDLTLSVIPVLLGAGIRLFPGGAPERRWQLDGARTFDSGLVQLRYRRVAA